MFMCSRQWLFEISGTEFLCFEGHHGLCSHWHSCEDLLLALALSATHHTSSWCSC